MLHSAHAHANVSAMNHSSYINKDAVLHIQCILEAMLAGKRPAIDPQHNTTDSLFLGWLHRQFEQGMLIDHPGLLLDIADGFGLERSPDSHHLAPVEAPVSCFYPVCAELMDNAHKAKSALAEAGVLEQIFVPGIRWPERTHGARLDAFSPPAGTMIINGDVFSAKALLDVLADKLKPHTESVYAYVPVSITNQGLHYNELFEAIGLDHNDPWCEHAHVAVHRSYSGSAQWLARHTENRKGYFPPKIGQILGRHAYRFPRGGAVLFATKTSDKIDEMKLIVRGEPMVIARLDKLANFHNPDEVSRTYGGNAYEKADAACAAIRANKEHVLALLAQNNIDPEGVVVLAEDSGMHLHNQQALQHADLSGMERSLIFNEHQFPGQEFGLLVNGALGMRRTFSRFVEAIRASGTENWGYSDTSVIAISPLVDILQEREVRTMFYSGQVEGFISPEPKGRDGQVITEDRVVSAYDYLIPGSQQPTDAHLFGPSYTKSQLGMKYVDSNSPRTFAIKAMLADHRNDLLHEELPAQPALQKTTAELVIGVFSATSPDAACIEALGAEIKRQKLQARLHIIPIDWIDNPAKLDQHIAECGVMVLMPPPESPDLRAVLARLLLANSLIVTRQIHPRDKDKPLIFFNKESSLRPDIALYDTMRDLGMVNDQNGLLVMRAESAQEVCQYADQYRDTLPITYPSAAEEHFSPIDSGRFNVAIYCSATARNQDLNDEARAMGYWLAESEYGLVWGAGDRQMMGSVKAGLMDWERHHTGKPLPFMFGASMDYLIDVEASDPRAVKDVIRRHGAYLNCAHIYQRMRAMMDTSHCIVVLPGGAGTVQEAADAGLRNICAIAAGMPIKPVFIYNRPLALDPYFRSDNEDAQVVQPRFYQQLHALLPDDTWKQAGIVYCNSLDALKQAVDAVAANTKL